MNRKPKFDMEDSVRAETEPWVLKLFVARDSAASATAIVQLKRIKEEYLPPNSVVEIIDILEDMEVAQRNQILAIPTLVRKSPLPVRRIIGDLSDISTVLVSIGFVATIPKAV